MSSTMPIPPDRAQQDPKEIQDKPPFEQAPIQAPGTETQMTPPVDHGEGSYIGSGRLKDQVALITGADSGIGRAVAVAFAREGADILISYLNEDEDARETARLVEDAGRRAVVVPGDIQNEAHCQSLVQHAQAELGKVDILVNNAAFQMSHQSIQEMTAEEWDRTFRTNIFAMFYLSKAVLADGVMGPGGAIINTASIQAFDPEPSLIAYAPTKAAIVSFTKALAKEAIQKGIRVNAVAPGPVWTPLIPSTMPPEKVKTFGQDSAFGRPAQPAELAPVYVLLASPEASYITGEMYGVTGGQSPF